MNKYVLINLDLRPSYARERSVNLSDKKASKLNSEFIKNKINKKYIKLSEWEDESKINNFFA